jgi:membrane-bound lytic murein transglycosylase B
MQGKELRRRMLLRVLIPAAVVVTTAFAAAPASAVTGGTSVPAGGTSPTSSQPSGSRPNGATPAAANTGGATPGATRPASHDAKPPKKKKKKRKKRRRHHSHRPPRGHRPPPQTPAHPDAPVPAPTTGSTADIPATYLRIYKSAGKTYGVDWRLLAAIGKNESDHGRSTLPGVASGRNGAGCCSGPMQICTIRACGDTWGFYKRDGNGDGVMSVWDPADAIPAAAALVRDLQTQFGADKPKLLMAAYNAGSGNVQRYGGVPPFPETEAYVRRGTAYMALLG